MTIRSVTVWLAAFLAYELPAHYRVSRMWAAAAIFGAAAVAVWLWPIFTLSNTAWHGIAWWTGIGVLIAVLLFVLLGHFEWHWSARLLAAVAFASLLVVGSHALEMARKR